jgi:hypothetical protein
MWCPYVLRAENRIQHVIPRGQSVVELKGPLQGRRMMRRLLRPVNFPCYIFHYDTELGECFDYLYSVKRNGLLCFGVGHEGLACFRAVFLEISVGEWSRISIWLRAEYVADHADNIS